ncbi:centriolin-like [Anomaloglossus baeobatrachus]|uniref:centriolin-like n=1 Tax=Anomaloglossus baeobatrachus TaxID=238106 RepID=UPI003F4F8319
MCLECPPSPTQGPGSDAFGQGCLCRFHLVTSLCLGPSDVLGQNLLELQRQIGQILRKSEEEKKEAEERHQRLQKEVSALQERAHQAPRTIRRRVPRRQTPGSRWSSDSTRQRSDSTRQRKAAERQYEAAERQLENQVQRLNQKLRTMEEIQGLADQQLLKAEEERERLLAELHQLEAEIIIIIFINIIMLSIEFSFLAERNNRG